MLAEKYLTQQDFIFTPQHKMHETRMQRLPNSGGVGYTCRSVTLGFNLIPTRRHFWNETHSTPFIFPHRPVGSKRKLIGYDPTPDVRRIIYQIPNLSYYYDKTCDTQYKNITHLRSENYECPNPVPVSESESDEDIDPTDRAYRIRLYHERGEDMSSESESENDFYEPPEKKRCLFIDYGDGLEDDVSIGYED